MFVKRGLNIPHFKNFAATINFYTHPINVAGIFFCHMHISDLCHFLGQANPKTSSFLKLGSQTNLFVHTTWGCWRRFIPPFSQFRFKIVCRLNGFFLCSCSWTISHPSCSKWTFNSRHFYCFKWLCPIYASLYFIEMEEVILRLQINQANRREWTNEPGLSN